MYSSLTSFILGFHGCDRGVGELVLAGETRLAKSENRYDWLGHGIYFWENDPQRALSHAELIRNNPRRGRGPVHEAFVIGAVLDLGYCLNLFETKNLQLLQTAHRMLEISSQASATRLPENKSVGTEHDLLLRHLDCAVIEALHQWREAESERPFDSIRAVFWEGKELYPNAGFRERNHIQICVRNPNCIKGYFRPLQPLKGHLLP